MGKQVWQDTNWLNDVQKWVASTLSAQNIQQVATIETVQERPWSIVLKVPTEDGNFFFKASAEDSFYEVPLAKLLATVAPNATIQLVRTNTVRGWMLMQDAGQRLRETLIDMPNMRHWERLLPIYANLQIELAQQADKLLKTTIPIRTLQDFPILYTQILDDSALFRIEKENGMSEDDFQRLLDLSEPFAQKCELLASYNIPMSLHHGDLHDGNIFHSSEQYRFIDWGDACYSHPFFSLRTAYVSAESRFGLEENHPQLNRLRDAYLTSWQDFESHERLGEAFSLAKQLWAFSSLLSWHRGLTAYYENTNLDYAHVIPSLGRELLNYFDK